MTVHDQTRPTTTRFTGHALMQALGDRLIDVAIAADPQADVTDDVELIRQLSEQVTTICQDLLQQAHQYEQHSWTYKRHQIIYWFAALTMSTWYHSKVVQDLEVFDDLVDLCERLLQRYTRAYPMAVHDTRQGYTRQVREYRAALLTGLWEHAGRCLQKAELR